MPAASECRLSAPSPSRVIGARAKPLSSEDALVVYLSLNCVATAGDHLQVPLRRYISLEGIIKKLKLCRAVRYGKQR